MKLNLKKCSFVKQQIEYLGHAQTPAGLKELKSFLGLANYYLRPNKIVLQSINAS